ncbi:MAG: cobyric acid synthase [Actinomycetota bacterium]
MKAKTLMIQGTSSDAGKSLLVAALCRIMSDKGYKVAPFKSQNMALNSFVTEKGHEIGRAQALQAAAARIKPSVDMNPILLKPTDSQRAQVIVRGKVYKNLSAKEYHSEKLSLLKIVEESLKNLLNNFDMIIIEGAGSPAEINLKNEDIANMRIAKMADAPVILVGDIDRGGVFASLIGTLELLDLDERARIRGLAINKFRGDVSLLRPGIDFLEAKTGVKVVGVIPYMQELKIDSEDSLALDKANFKTSTDSMIDIAVIRLPHISNFTDIDIFMHEQGVNLRYVEPGSQIGETDLLIVPGTKNTVDDMRVLHETGMTEEIRRLRELGTPIIGICGGYQMLGKEIRDNYGIESSKSVIDGIGLLNCITSIIPSKVTVQVEAVVCGGGAILGPVGGKTVTGYEIHMGVTKPLENTFAAFRIKKRGNIKGDVNDGCVSSDGLVIGTYIHGIFDNGEFRKGLLDFLKARKGLEQDSSEVEYDVYRQKGLDYLAKAVSDSLDMDYIFKIMGVSDHVGPGGLSIRS